MTNIIFCLLLSLFEVAKLQKILRILDYFEDIHVHHPTSFVTSIFVELLFALPATLN